LKRPGGTGWQRRTYLLEIQQGLFENLGLANGGAIHDRPEDFCAWRVYRQHLVNNNPMNNIDPFGLYIDQFPSNPPGYNPTTWKTGQWDSGKWNLTSPEGDIYTLHEEIKALAPLG
jgi:hypothetical protein